MEIKQKQNLSPQGFCFSNVLCALTKGKKRQKKALEKPQIDGEEHFLLLWRQTSAAKVQYLRYLTLPKYLTEVDKVNKVNKVS